MTRVMGIEIGNSYIKMIEVIKKEHTQIIKKFSLIPTPEACIYNGVIGDAGPLQKVIKEELKRKKYQAKKVVCIIQSSHIIIRHAEIEKYPEKSISQLIEIKTEDFLPIEQEQYQIDFKILEEVEEKGVLKNKLLLVAAPNTVVLPVINLIKRLKLTPMLISVPSEALENIFNAEVPMIDEHLNNIMILDIGGKSTTVTIVTNGKVCLTRLIEYGIDDLREDIKEFSEDGHEADLENMMRPEIEYNIVAEIERILQFYYSSHRDYVIHKIYIIGGGVNIKGIREHIRDALNIPTEKLNHLDAVSEENGIDFESHTSFFVNLLGIVSGV